MPKEAQAPQSLPPQRENFLKRILNNLKRKESGQSAVIEAGKEGGLKGAFATRIDSWNQSTRNYREQYMRQYEGSESKPSALTTFNNPAALAGSLLLGEMTTSALRDRLAPKQPQQPK